jgi:hypothetical protein
MRAFLLKGAAGNTGGVRRSSRTGHNETLGWNTFR